MSALMLAYTAALGRMTITPLFQRSEWRSAAHSSARQANSASAPRAYPGATSVSASR